ncbi:MAG: hypothetical protein PHX80_04370 [Candidatus Nanoarchaeia archaeon]|nr:hypothetical protein [Candidatus Nanoarchaeia archaeon]
MIEKAKKRGMPYTVLIAQDRNSTFALEAYAALCAETGVSDEQIEYNESILMEFRDWQQQNKEKTKLPD